MIRRCHETDFDAICGVINDAAQAYSGVIPADCYCVPYMPADHLRTEIGRGVEFWGYEDERQLVGVMGIQHIKDITLMRHAYVLTHRRNQGIGGMLLGFLVGQTNRPVLVGTWEAAHWAVSFYRKHGFVMVSHQDKDRLLREYWTISDRQVETSVVSQDEKWRRGHHGRK